MIFKIKVLNSRAQLYAQMNARSFLRLSEYMLKFSSKLVDLENTKRSTIVTQSSSGSQTFDLILIEQYTFERVPDDIINNELHEH